VMDAPIPLHDRDGDLLHGIPVLNPARLDLAYAWPVHRIGPGHRPRKPQATHLVAYRDADDHVQFTVINPVTARLLALLSGGKHSGADALRQVATELQHPDPQELLGFGAGLLGDLRRQGILLGAG
jgi:uncharacterized protein